MKIIGQGCEREKGRERGRKHDEEEKEKGGNGEGKGGSKCERKGKITEKGRVRRTSRRGS